jgi:hypothetical protein
VANRPVLSLSYSTDPGAAPPVWTYPVTVDSQGRTIWVSPTGNDATGSGFSSSPVRSPRRALEMAYTGDTINLMTGVYAGGISFERAGITLQSAPGHWATLSLVTDDPISAVNVITLRPGADNGVLRNLEIVGACRLVHSSHLLPWAHSSAL